MKGVRVVEGVHSSHWSLADLAAGWGARSRERNSRIS